MLTVLLRERKELVFSVTALAFSLFCAMVAFSYPKDSSSFPRILCVTLILLSLFMLCKSLKVKSNDDAACNSNIYLSRRNIIFYLLCCIYIIALTTIGFYVSTYCYVFCTCIFLKCRNKIIIVVWPAILCLLLYIVFSCLLLVPTPAGILF